MRLDALLPSTSFIAFPARGIRKPEVRWANPQLATDFPFLEHAWCSPLNGDSPEAYDDRQVQLLAERYGGHGLGGNGGGARCGVIGEIQIKGVGRNQLAAPDTDFFHSYGGASINEGVYESLWGEILNRALPHGAVRVIGLVATGTRVPLVAPLPGQDPTTERALIFRQAAIRPAHFMRSAYHRPPVNSGWCDDTSRTRAAIAALPAVFSALYCLPSMNESSDVFIHRCMSIMLERFADQFASARAKRLMHGSLIASNIALDGRWLDFATTSAVPDFGHIVSPRGPDFLQEELMLQPGIADLAFYLRKYLKTERHALFDGTELWQRLHIRLKQRLPLEYAKLTGIPADVCASLPLQTDHLYTVIEAITRRGNGKVYLMMSDSSEAARKTPVRTGDHSLNAIMRKAAFSTTPAETDAALQTELDDAKLRARFVQAYWSVRYEAERLLAVRGSYGPIFCMLNAARLNANNHFLYRPQLYHDIEQALLTGVSAARLIESTVQRGISLLEDDTAGWADLREILGEGFAVCVKDGLLYRQQPLSSLSLPRSGAVQLTLTEQNIIQQYEAKIANSSRAYG
ncbi:hypothetical protein SAMN05192549_12615 [Duganella sacchari]|uniref:Uncharacterized protein n=1 Tax=Duganella sacchari TaxID=551987 RepID=A0A1M7RF44_9BURK|nr:hypothetical protein [Duganella sacchari]SHN44779.1 hypothetical protein SAMN05192549_12615 [Duganella sacchari]